MMNTREYEQYVAVTTVKHDFVNAVQKLSGTALYRVEERSLQSVLDKTKEIEHTVTDKIDNPDDIPQEFWDYGTEINDGKCRDFKI